MLPSPRQVIDTVQDFSTLRNMGADPVYAARQSALQLMDYFCQGGKGDLTIDTKDAVTFRNQLHRFAEVHQMNINGKQETLLPFEGFGKI